MGQATVIWKMVRKTWALTPNDYEGVEELSSLPSTTSLVPRHVKAAWITYHYEQQEQ